MRSPIQSPPVHRDGLAPASRAHGDGAIRPSANSTEYCMRFCAGACTNPNCVAACKSYTGTPPSSVCSGH